MEPARAADSRGGAPVIAARLLLAALAGAAAIAVPAAPVAAAAPAKRDWSRTVAVTPEGGYRVGNPDAPVKLIEFVSLTCGHCASFSAEGVPALLQGPVKAGRVSFELRNYFLNGIDLVAAVASRCAAPQHYFPLSAEILAKQEEWTGRIRAMSEAERAKIAAMPPLEGMAAVADRAGLDEIAARHGIGAAALRACFTEERANRLIAMNAAAERDFGVQATPSFAINGKLMPQARDWTTLQPLLRPPPR